MQAQDKLEQATFDCPAFTAQSSHSQVAVRLYLEWQSGRPDGTAAEIMQLAAMILAHFQGNGLVAARPSRT